MRIFESKEVYENYSKASRDAFVRFSQFDTERAWKRVIEEDIKKGPAPLKDQEQDAWRFLDTTMAFYQESLKRLPVIEKTFIT